MRPLLASVSQPENLFGLGAPVHPGAQSFYDKDKPAFIEQYADVVALLVTLALLVGSWVWELRRWLIQPQKNRADQYNHQVVAIMTSAQGARHPGELELLRRELLQLLTDVVCALDEDRISEESFQSFRVVWQIAIDLLRERRDLVSDAAIDEERVAIAVN